MSKIYLFIKNHQQQIALLVGYLFVAGLAFGLGRYSDKPQSVVTNATNLPSNYSPNISSAQTQATPTENKQMQPSCEGKIKGSSSLIYHVPGGSFYNKTTKPIRCFDTESEAQAAGFRKSSR